MNFEGICVFQYVPCKVRTWGLLSMRQVKIDRPILRIPMLAIHLQREIYDKGFNPNKQTHLPPIIATAIKAAVGDDASPDTKAPSTTDEKAKVLFAPHPLRSP
jgi:aspartyl aminopeptidase